MAAPFAWGDAAVLGLLLGAAVGAVVVGAWFGTAKATMQIVRPERRSAPS